MRVWSSRVGYSTAFCFVLTFIAGWSSEARAWGSPGHQYVGNLAWQLLNPNAQSHVAELLGPAVDLAHAAVWPDCIRSVSGAPGKKFTYASNQETPDACEVFGGDDAEKLRMEDYASRNWTNCEYSGKNLKCNLAFHFADVNVLEHDTYSIDDFGAGKADVVQAIKAALAKLKCGSTDCPVPAPFNIRDQREALFLLAHFVGDVHQPLHVGAIYLDAQNHEGGDSGAGTTGGNALLLKPGNKNNNLHHEWDTIELAAEPDAAVVVAGCSLIAMPLAVPEDWASESVVLAKAAYGGMTFSRDTVLPDHWDITFDKRKDYTRQVGTAQAERLKWAGVRLASELNAIWPSAQKPTACS
jgi:hypothetical protein